MKLPATLLGLVLLIPTVLPAGDSKITFRVVHSVALTGELTVEAVLPVKFKAIRISGDPQPIGENFLQCEVKNGERDTILFECKGAVYQLSAIVFSR